MRSNIEFPARKIKVINADIEIDVGVSDQEYERLIDVFNKNEMDPLIKLTIISPSGAKAEFTNLNIGDIPGMTL